MKRLTILKCVFALALVVLTGCASSGNVWYNSAERKPCHFTEVEVHGAYGMKCMTPADMRRLL